MGARAATVLLAAAALVAGCSSVPDMTSAPVHLDPSTFLAENPLSEDQSMRADRLVRTPHLSIHAVQLRDHVPARVLPMHDKTVRVLHGTVEFRFGVEPVTRPVEAVQGRSRAPIRAESGDVVVIPRGVVHETRVIAGPTALLITLTPAATDRALHGTPVGRER